MVPISEDIIDDAIKIGERIGIPYLTLIERILISVLKIMKYKSNVLDVLSILDSLDDIKKLGGVILPISVINIISTTDVKIFESICKEYNKMGIWFGELSRIKRSVTINEIKQAISIWLPVSSIDVSVEGNEYKIVIGFIGQNNEIVHIARCVIEGLIKGYNLLITEISIKDVFIVIKVRGFVEE